MSRRWTGKMRGEQFLGNKQKMEVHDLDKENSNANGCQIDEIIRAGHEVPFTTLGAAHSQGYDNCAKCLGTSKR
jgi:hypothetical protein